MDIRNNKTILQAKIKRFTLKATASAVLTLNAEAVMAINCPAEISGTTLASIICDFNSTTPSVSSVTVENGGTVGGILMDNYQPTNSFITVDAGGLVSNTTGIGIALTHSSSLSNGLSNHGTISSSSGVGISISDASTITGGIFNSGMISTHSTDIIIGGQSHIDGGIFNSGTIASSDQGTGILIKETSTITGNIFNSGIISGGGNDSGISILTNSIVNGGVTNQGLINATDGNAIDLSLSRINSGGILNSGRIESTNSNAIRVGNQSTIDYQITNSGLISGGANGISIISGSTVGGVVNSGTIIGNIAGLNISSSALSGGISNSGTIQGDTFVIYMYGTTSHIDILGQKARIIGAVDAANTDLNITDGALFSSEGNYTVNTFNIVQNALFNMANTVTVTNGFNNSGTLAVSNTQTIIGDYTQNTGGVFQTAVSDSTHYGQLSVSNTADLSQSGNIDVQIAPTASLHVGDVLTNVMSATTFTPPTNGFNVTDNSVIWTFIGALNNANTGVDLTLEIDPAAYAVCRGDYCQGAANTIIGQVASGNSVFSPYGALPTASALQTAASQATPELTNENIQIIQLITRAVVDIVPMWSSLRGRSSGDAMLYQPGKLWVKPYGASMTQNERNTVNGFNAAAYGAVVGKDIELSNNWLFGGAFAAGGDNIKGKSVLSGQSIHSNAYQGMLYGSKKLPNQFYVAGQGLVGYGNNNTSRAIPLYASTAKGSYNSWFTNIRAEAGWSRQVFSPNFVFTPEIDASYLFINQGSYQESGSLMDLSVASNNNSSLVLGAYGNGAYHLTTLNDQRDLTLTAYAGVAGDVIQSQPQVTSTFVAAGSSFSTFGVQFNGAVFRGGVGLMLTTPTKPLVVELNYDLQVGNNAYSGVGAATIKYKL